MLSLFYKIKAYCFLSPLICFLCIMGLFNTTNADTPKKDTSREKQTVEMELFLTVMHDGGYKAQGQKIQRDLYRSGRSVNLRDEEEVGISFEGIDNPKV